MNLYEISDDLKVYPGEYVFHVPTKQIVLCGSFMREKKQMRVLVSGKMFTDNIDNFRKIKLSRSENKQIKPKGCSGCKKK